MEDEATAGCIGGATAALFGQGIATRGNGADQDAVLRPYSPSPGVAAGTGGDGLDLSDDSMSMYVRDMDSSALLTREGEAALANRIEAGRRTMLDSLCSSLPAMAAVSTWRDTIRGGSLALRQVIDVKATYGGRAPGRFRPPGHRRSR